jgi:hypothetical protein
VNPYAQHSQKLIQCLIKLDLPETKVDAKMEFLSLTSILMPAGNPTYLDMIKYPMIRDLISDHGKKTMLKVVYLLIRDFCNSLNVVRNMNEDQMIEAAAMLIDECSNFRLEDYAIMFSMGKRGELLKIYDRIDISVITQMLDEYWKRRNAAAIKLQEPKTEEGFPPSSRLLDNFHPADTRLINSVDRLGSAFGDLKNKLMEWRDGNDNKQ